jgi:hypothetical protein
LSAVMIEVGQEGEREREKEKKEKKYNRGMKL